MATIQATSICRGGASLDFSKLGYSVVTEAGDLYSQFALQNLIHRPPLFNVVDLKEIEVFIELRIFAAGPKNPQKPQKYLIR